MMKDKKFYGYLEGWSSIIINTLLFIFKLIVGIQSHSISIIADAWHTMSDSITSLIVIIGFKISSKPPDKNHPFGHGMVENIMTIIIGTMLGIVGFNFIVDSIKKLIQKESALFNINIIIVFVISCVIKELLAQFSFYLSRKINSDSLKADGWHHRSDAIASLLILVGLFFSKHLWWIDGVLGIIVALLIIYTAKEIIFDTSKMILGEEINNELKDKIINKIKDVSPDIKTIHHFHLHQYGDHKELTIHICLPNNMSVEESHRLTQKIESTLRTELNLNTTIHVEPINR